MKELPKRFCIYCEKEIKGSAVKDEYGRLYHYECIQEELGFKLKPI